MCPDWLALTARRGHPQTYLGSAPTVDSTHMVAAPIENLSPISRISA